MFSTSASAKIYRWVDEKGKVHYSDKPPADQDKAKTVELKTKEKASDNNKKLTPQERTQRANKWLQGTRDAMARRQQDKQKVHNDKRKQREQQENAAARCKMLKAEYENYYYSTGGIYDYNKKGEKYYFDEEQTKKFLEDLKKKVDSACAKK